MTEQERLRQHCERLMFSGGGVWKWPVDFVRGVLNYFRTRSFLLACAVGGVFYYCFHVEATIGSILVVGLISHLIESAWKNRRSN